VNRVIENDLDLEMRPDITMDDLLATLTRHSNLLIFGRPERGEEDQPGSLTAFRAVVLVGGVLGLNPIGEVDTIAIGVLNGDNSAHARRTWPKMAAKLRTIADELERMAREQEPS
jgi:hypothetical protein